MKLYKRLNITLPKLILPIYVLIDFLSTLCALLSQRVPNKLQIINEGSLKQTALFDTFCCVGY
ncbi:hypothetical protein VCRA2122O12_140044 [Vibrio crassostreae]|nr:hypothetical protein VCRA2110O4_70096 [Vibrio crassostreae]CAK2153941.1 hypothetical protein VCRA2110O1_70081 [Vibrio crassostreae]CAK2184327.1 hypothetical protein VCRA2114E5_90082 [Vibrio crassostreae]CAK2566109.1 hypothetical protein VCRA2110O3_150044 [Vibrio crassostreae]CAK2575216.1 hypothetical protein VCRA2110O2_150044 [Vibrio crassostreae]